MNTTSQNLRVSLKTIPVVLLAITLAVPWIPGFPTEARADDGAAFVGGMLAGHVLGGMVRRSRIRTAAEVHQAYGQPQQAPAHPAPAPAPAPAAKPTAEQRLQELDKLAAGGYITPAEYKAKKKAILDSM